LGSTANKNEENRPGGKGVWIQGEGLALLGKDRREKKGGLKRFARGRFSGGILIKVVPP